MNSTDQPAKPQTRQTNPFKPPEELEPTASNPFEPPRKQKPPRATLSSLMTPTLVTNFDPTFKHPTRNFAPKSSRAVAERQSSAAAAGIRKGGMLQVTGRCRVQRLVRRCPGCVFCLKLRTQRPYPQFPRQTGAPPRSTSRIARSAF